MESVQVEVANGVARVTLNRPEVRNAFNDALVSELAQAFEELAPDVRVVVLTGAGKAFCAGADLNWMMKSVQMGDNENAEDAAAMVKLFQTIDQSPRVVIGRINGPAIGGGLGLVACCDVVATLDTVKFGFSEVRLGVVPAVISPFVLRKLPVSAARRYFLTGELFGAEQARYLGLVHEVVPAAELDSVVEKIADAVLKTGPNAVAEAKKLIRVNTGEYSKELLDYTVKTIARLRVSPEAQEGFGAFLQKRKPDWPKLTEEG